MCTEGNQGSPVNAIAQVRRRIPQGPHTRHTIEPFPWEMKIKIIKSNHPLPNVTTTILLWCTGLHRQMSFHAAKTWFNRIVIKLSLTMVINSSVTITMLRMQEM